MKKKIIVLMLAVMLAVSMTGCTATTNTGDVKSDADVKKTVGDVSTDIENVQSTLNDIDLKLG